MDFLQRRDFLKRMQGAFGGALLFPLINGSGKVFGQINEIATREKPCWLDLSAPFVVDDISAGIRSEIILTSDTFVGPKGHEDDRDATEYEIYLYNTSGKLAIPGEGVKRLTAPAMHTTVIPVRELLTDAKSFTGGLRVRLRPTGRERMHASDLFSSAFVRWSTKDSFDNVHANPDPLEWQKPESFFYSMPFPPLSEYECVYGLFNPYDTSSSGSLMIYDSAGRKVSDVFYDLKPHSSRFFDLRTGKFVDGITGSFVENARANSEMITESGGTIAVTNREGSVKNFGYLAIKRPGRPRFSIDHPIHQSPFDPQRSEEPFDENGRFKAKNILYTPLAFRSKQIGGITLDSRFHLSSGAPIEEYLWLSPFLTNKDGDVAWAAKDGSEIPASVSRKQVHRNAIKLAGKQSCILDCKDLPLPDNFSGGLFLGVKLNTNHTLMKVEINVPEWGAHAFTHFRPGLASARMYQKAKQRGGIATDYITSGARLERNGKKVIRDEVICVLNIDDKAIVGRPTLEVFSSSGLVARVNVGDVPAFGSRHLLLSELSSANDANGELSMRLFDESATLLMSVVHIDYARRDIAIDHGSDRFSTFHEFDCDPKRS